VREEYIDSIERLSSSLTEENYRQAVELADLPAMIRGFGDVKARALAQYREQREKLSVIL
jgi:indolepyruvate ferredoxin oxidoreductase